MSDTYLLYDPDDGWQEYQDLDAAERAFDHVIDTMREDAEYDGEWHGDIETVALYQARRVLGVQLVPVGEQDDGEPAMDLEVIDEREATDPLTGKASPIAAVLAHLASQEGCDGEPWDQMQAGADEIERLQQECRDRADCEQSLTRMLLEVQEERDTATLMLAAVRHRAEQDGLQALSDAEDVAKRAREVIVTYLLDKAERLYDGMED